MAKSLETVIDVVVPTAINTVLMVNENIVSNLRLRKDAEIVVPSLYQRALMIVNETTEIAIIRQKVGE